MDTMDKKRKTANLPCSARLLERLFQFAASASPFVFVSPEIFLRALPCSNQKDRVIIFW